MKEVWKDIKDHKNYKVSNLGRVKRIPYKYRKIEKILINDVSSKWGYYRVTLSKNGKDRKYLVSRLVAQAFIPNNKNLPEVNHNDGNKTNNCVNNLEWVTPSENILHAFKLGLRTIIKGENCSWAKLKENDVYAIRKNYSCGLADMPTLAKHYNVSITTISGIIHRKIWKHI